MSTSVASQGVWSLVVQSDFTTKIVLSTLFMMSIISWAVALYKFILFRIKKQQCQQVAQELSVCKTMTDVSTVIQKHHKTLPGYVLLHVYAQIQQAKEVGSLDSVGMYVDQILDEVMYQEESYTPILSITSAVATLLGLFGTVWGLVHSFIRISEKQSADIVTVAPGIAEALITTVAGLIVAIPALTFFHLVNVLIKDLEYRLVGLTDKVMNIARSTTVKPAQQEVVDKVDTSETTRGHDETI